MNSPSNYYATSDLAVLAYLGGCLLIVLAIMMVVGLRGDETKP